MRAGMCLWICFVLFLCPFYWCALPPPCDSEIYCYGDILRQVQTAKLFDDDKYFVDMKLKSAPDIILTAFHNLTHGDPNSVPPAVLRDFLLEYFEEPGMEFEPWFPPDWHDKPQFLTGIADAELRSWAEKLHHLWKSLGRKISSDALANPDQYSQIFTPHPFVVPGGRFRELYYWDSYWVINGLLLSEMTDTARGMILNFIHLINRYGFIPNGARVYYERRSQPPFLTLMVESYYQTTNDKDFLRTALPALDYNQPTLLGLALPALEQEYYCFWMRNRSVAVRVTGSTVPEPFDVSVGLPDAAERLWKELHSGARVRTQRSVCRKRDLAHFYRRWTSGGLDFPNGVPTSLVDSGQQWDYPNAWPPLQHILIQGLSSLPSQEAKELGFDLAQRWIRTNWLAYVKYEAMFEKYNVNGDGKPGGGGEYEVQLGFGWTNGVALQLLSQYGDRLTSGGSGNGFAPCLSISVSVALLCSAQTLFL
nr:trehalase [Salvelinus alpinus]